MEQLNEAVTLRERLSIWVKIYNIREKGDKIDEKVCTSSTGRYSWRFAPIEGVLNGDEESTDALLNGIMGFSYEGKDEDGNNVNVTLSASFLTETPYVTAAE